MEFVLVKTEYNWNEMLELPGFDVWQKDRLEFAKKIVTDYFKNGGSPIWVPMGKDNMMEFRGYNDVFGPWCYLVEYTITEDEFKLMTKLTGGQHGLMTFGKVVKEVIRTINETAENPISF